MFHRTLELQLRVASTTRLYFRINKTDSEKSKKGIQDFKANSFQRQYRARDSKQGWGLLNGTIKWTFIGRIRTSCFKDTTT